MAINYVIAGHLKDGTVLASIGIGCTALNLLAIAIFHGINSAQESLASQAYGSGRLDLCMVYLNRGRVCILAIQAPTIFLLYFFSEEILILFGQPESTIANAQQYIFYSLPGLFFYA